MNLLGFGEQRIRQHGHHHAMLPSPGAGEHLNGFSMGESLLPPRGAHGLGDSLRTQGTLMIKESDCGISESNV